MLSHSALHLAAQQQQGPTGMTICAPCPMRWENIRDLRRAITRSAAPLNSQARRPEHTPPTARMIRISYSTSAQQACFPSAIESYALVLPKPRLAACVRPDNIMVHSHGLVHACLQRGRCSESTWQQQCTPSTLCFAAAALANLFRLMQSSISWPASFGTATLASDPSSSMTDASTSTCVHPSYIYY